MKSFLALIGFGVVAYVFLFVPLGTRTAFQHCRNIAGTDEAQQLRQEAAQAASRWEGDLESELDELRPDAGVPDARSTQP